jgi:lipoate-protein ligase A
MTVTSPRIASAGDGHLKLLDLTLPTPEENLACDEALLESLESDEGAEILRFWESASYFVVLGSSNKVQEEVHIEACRADGIPILRRHSGGGTVLQGPGCLNYSLILRIDPHSTTRNITSTTHYVMNRHAQAFSDLLNTKVEMNGSSDLTIAGKKISGNAQRRKLKAGLFHGTFLLDLNLSNIEKYLKMPPKQPAYRERRSHLDFLTNIRVDSALLKRRLGIAWNATETVQATPPERIAALVLDKYSRVEWNFKF